MVLALATAALRALASRLLVSVRFSEMPLTVTELPPARTAASICPPAELTWRSVAVTDSLTV